MRRALFNFANRYASNIAAQSIAQQDSSALVDKFGRFHSYLRVSLTERCNLRCTYCMPEEGVPLNPNSKLLTADEIVRVASVFSHLGVDKVRLTGGEPTVRKDLIEIVGRLAELPGMKHVAMTSNGIVIGRMLDELVKIGLDQLNLSLDTLSEAKYQMITRRNGFTKVMQAIDKAEPLFNLLKINCVVIRGINEQEVCDFVALTEHRKLDVRFIEYMPFGGNRFESKKMVSYKEMLTEIDKKWPNVVRLKDKENDTSKAYGIPGFAGRFGFITSMSEHFCDTCNRLRVTADGNLKVCLHGNAEVSLRDTIRSGASDDQLIEVIAGAVSRKKKQHAGMDNLINMTNRPMILIGNLLARLTRSLPFFVRAYSTTSKDDKVEAARMSHVDAKGKAKMVDVSEKAMTTRTATAIATIRVTDEIMRQLVNNELKKGDAIGVSRIAGVMAAKRTSDLIPLCHNIELSNIQLDIQLEDAISILSRVTTAHSQTGVEMEALMAVSIAALTIYDMCKAISHEMIISDIRLTGKAGGKRDFGNVSRLNEEG